MNEIIVSHEKVRIVKNWAGRYEVQELNWEGK